MAYKGCRRNDSEVVRGIILLAPFTGMRRGNILAMRWDEVDWENGQWTIPANKTKTSRTYPVKLADMAIAVLQRMHVLRVGDCPWVFPQGHDPTNHIKCIKKSWDEISCAGPEAGRLRRRGVHRQVSGRLFRSRFQVGGFRIPPVTGCSCIVGVSTRSD